MCMIWTKNKSRECTNSQACLVLTILYISFFSWTNTKNFSYRACTSLHRLQKYETLDAVREPCILDGARTCARARGQCTGSTRSRPRGHKGLGYKLRKRASIEGPWWSSAGAAEKKGERATARTGTAPRLGLWCRRRHRTWRAAGHHRCRTPPARSPRRAAHRAATTRNPLIHDEFFVTFMNTVINRQNLWRFMNFRHKFVKSPYGL